MAGKTMIRRNLNHMTRVGLIFLVLASTARLSARRLAANVPESAVDLSIGLLYGVAIGCLLLGLSRCHAPRPSA